MLKVELHTHTSDDPVDRIPHTSTELIDHAVALGYQALAITLHEHQLDIRGLVPYAAERGLVLIPGVEISIEGRHVLLLNFKSGADEIRSLRMSHVSNGGWRGLVIAPHPFFPAPTCLRGQLDRHAHLFDAVEYNAMFTAIHQLQSRGRAMGGRARQTARWQLRRPPPASAWDNLFIDRC